MIAKISVIQFQPALADPEENTRRLQPLFDKIEGSRLVIMPELSNSGYNFKDFREASSCSEVIGRNSLFQDFLLNQARAKNIYIVSGINEREEDRLYNSAILVGPGGIIGKYRKMHLFMNEKDISKKAMPGCLYLTWADLRSGS